MTRPWRAVLPHPDGTPLTAEDCFTGRGSLLGPDTARRTRWFELRLECGHQVERTVRYRSLGKHAQRGGTQYRLHDDILPPPRRVRCEFCPREERS